MDFRLFYFRVMIKLPQRCLTGLNVLQTNKLILANKFGGVIPF